MKLKVPIDFQILTALSDGYRNNGANLAYILDRDRGYINTRLPVLADYELVERIGPSPNSGLYIITEKGQIAADHRDVYESEETDFEKFIEKKI
ncbi:hypothetical protein SAMN05192561_10253 [Halopenitus malekzadehii]|uniref:Phage repressor protein n=1 Tax=Halopenitus malekzadehii TaxID=1267564 RepID=A0A1H6I8Z1_9EURY|nr:phage repressor protein [Halopenitus malekzadehii]SEH45641.1 hypothetical protein SAMN05192561_10253 [Halopenitus malekzadehii]